MASGPTEPIDLRPIGIFPACARALITSCIGTERVQDLSRSGQVSFTSATSALAARRSSSGVVRYSESAVPAAAQTSS